MKTKKLWTSLALAGALASPILAAAACGAHQEAQIPIEDARAAAVERVPGQIVEEELEREDGRLIYSFHVETSDGRGAKEVNVDANDGRIVSVETEDDDDAVDEAEADEDSRDGRARGRRRRRDGRGLRQPQAGARRAGRRGSRAPRPSGSARRSTHRRGDERRATRSRGRGHAPPHLRSPPPRAPSAAARRFCARSS